MYKTITRGNDARVKTYRGTVTSKTDPELLELKANIKRRNDEINEANERIMSYIEQGVVKRIAVPGGWIKVPYSILDLQTTLRVRLMGRGPRQSIRAEARSKGYHGDLSCYLPMEFATSFDVYVHHNSNDTLTKYAKRLGFDDYYDAWMYEPPRHAFEPHYGLTR